MEILLVEDEEPISEVEKAYLERENFAVTVAKTGYEALKFFEEQTYDLVVLDLNLPQIDGVAVCKKIRERSLIPVIMVTARVEEVDEILGLEIGADDYLKKPFSPHILVARVQALLRRVGFHPIKIGPFTIDPNTMAVEKNGEKLSLTTTQFNILYFLATQKGRVFTREQIMDGAYSEVIPKDIFDRTIDAHIKAIRKIIEDDCKTPQYIVTVIGKGYKFNESTT